MTGKTQFRKMGKGLEVAMPDVSAYPISTDEWTFLRQRVQSFSSDVNWLSLLFSLCLGASGSLAITIWAGGFSDPNARPIAWVVAGGLAVVGAVSLLAAGMVGSRTRTEASEVVEVMDLVKSRFEKGSESPDAEPTPSKPPDSQIVDEPLDPPW